MLVRIYDFELAMARGVIHSGSSQKEKTGGALMDSELQVRSPRPLWIHCPARGGAPGPEFWGLRTLAKGSRGVLVQVPATPGLPAVSTQFVPHLGGREREREG